MAVVAVAEVVAVELLTAALPKRRLTCSTIMEFCITVVEPKNPVETIAVFGIAGSARVGESARSPPPVPTLGFGERFFWKKNPAKCLFGDVCAEKIDFFGKLL